MPQRIAGPQRTREVNPNLFMYCDGTWSYFNPRDKSVIVEPVYATQEEAWPHWCAARREVWAKSNRFMPPKASMIYDGLTKEAWEILWKTWGSKDFSLVAIFRALAADRASVEVFRQDDPEGAADVDDFLNLWLEDLDVIQSEARRISEAKERGELFPGVPQITSGRKYADEARAK